MIVVAIVAVVAVVVAKAVEAVEAIVTIAANNSVDLNSLASNQGMSLSLS